MSQWARGFLRPNGWAAILAFLFGAAPAWACLVCTEQPETTLTDRVWAADAVVLARNTPQDLYAYAASRTLMGAADAPTEFTVNSIERQRMASDPDRVALFLLEPRGWSLAGHGGAEFAALIGDVLAHETQWTDAFPDPDRIAYFAARHAHADPLIRRMALTELSRVHYTRLRDIEIELEQDWITARLSDASWFGWWPILIHMTGLHPDPAMRDLIRSHALDAPPATRSAWWVALIETAGAEAVDDILARVRTDEDALMATRAFIAHADPERELAPHIAAALGQLAERGPLLAAEATVGLYALGDWSLVPLVIDLLKEGEVSDPATDFALKLYLAQSRGFAAHRWQYVDPLPQ